MIECGVHLLADLEAKSLLYASYLRKTRNCEFCDVNQSYDLSDKAASVGPGAEQIRPYCGHLPCRHLIL